MTVPAGAIRALCDIHYSFFIRSAIRVHRVAHAGPVGLEEVAGGGDDFEAEEEEVADGLLGEVGVEADDQAVEGDGGALPKQRDKAYVRRVIYWGASI